MYRVITGACKSGTQVFLDAHPELSKRKHYIVQEIFGLTQGEYGSDALKRFFVKVELLNGHHRNQTPLANRQRRPRLHHEVQSRSMALGRSVVPCVLRRLQAVARHPNA
jgi:hypothetical protein